MADILSKTCVVVGVGPGLGHALCERFGREGYKVAMMARSFDKLEEMRRGFQSAGIEAHAFRADAGDTESLIEAFKDVEERLGAPEVMIYNVIGVHPGAPTNLDAKTLSDDLSVSVTGALTSAKQVLAPMVERNAGTVLFTGGGAALNPWPAYASISITKAGLRMLALNLAEELKDTGIRVGTVTVSGMIGKSEHFAPARIAQVFWELHTGEAQVEVMYE